MMYFVLFPFLFLVDFCTAKPTSFIDRKNQVVDILYEMTGFEGPYIFNFLKQRDGKLFVCKVDCADKSYIVRFNQDCYKSARVDEIGLHRYANENGFGPAIFYANEDEGVIIMEYLITFYPEGTLDGVKKMDRLISLVKKIHASSIVCQPKEGFVSDVLNRLSSRLDDNCYGLNLLSLQESLKFLEQCIDTAIKPVFVHGDLHEWNLFFCQDTCKAIDFETAHYDHPYVDLASLALDFCPNSSQEVCFLEKYWDRPITGHDLQQFAIFKLFSLASIALWMIDSLDDAFVETQEYQEMFYINPSLVELYCNPIQWQKSPAMRHYRAAICALKEAERVVAFLQDSFKVGTTF